MALTIGQAARACGLSVKTVRYYADTGVVAPTGRTDSGYRLYDDAAVARLQLVAALRRLGLPLEAVAQVVRRRQTLEEAVAAEADTIDVHIAQLQLRRSVLRAIARGNASIEEVHRMTDFAHASREEARHLMEDFITDTLTADPSGAVASHMRQALPELPAEPSAAQIDAWVELAALVSDQGFRRRVREMSVAGASLHESGDSDRAADMATALMEQAQAALDAGTDPASDEARAVVDRVCQVRFADGDAPARRRELLNHLRTFTDARVDRYWQLIGTINGWPQAPSMVPAHVWFIDALAASLR